MRLTDIPEVNLAESSQDEAINHIKLANRFEVAPQYVKEDPKLFQQKYQKAQYEEQEVTPTIGRMIASNTETAAAIAPESKTFSTVEKVFGNIKNSVSATVGPEARHRELGWKMARQKRLGADKVTQDEMDEYNALQEMAKSNFGRTDYGGELIEQLPGMFAGALIDIPLTVYRNPKLSAAFMSLPALGGAVVGGALGGPVGALKGASMGAARGLGAGFLPIMSYDAYQNATGETWNKLGNLRDEAGRNDIIIDDMDREFIAHGVGAVSASLSLAGGMALQKFAPILKNLKSTKYLAQLATRPGMQATRSSFRLIGGLLSEGTEESLQEIVSIIGEEIGASSDTSESGETSFYEGLLRAANKIENDPKTKERLAAAGIVGMGVGGTVVGGAALAQKAVDKRAAKTPAPTEAKAKTEPKSNPKPYTDITPPSNDPKAMRMDSALEVQGTLEFQTFLDLQSEAIKNTNLAQKAPEQVAEIRRNLARDNGLPYVWFDIDALRPLADDPNKGQLIRDMLGPDVDFAVENNQLVQVDTEKMMAVHDQIPQLGEIVRVRPEAIEPGQVESFLKAREEQQAKAREVFDRLKVDQGRDPLTRAYDVNLNPAMDDIQLAEGLKTQEVADGYLSKLDNEDVAFADAKNVDGLAMNNILRERITAIKDSLPKDVDTGRVLLEAMANDLPDIRTFTEGDYLNQPSLVDAINSISPVKEADAINEAQRAARQEISDNIQETAQYEMNKVIDVTEAQAQQVQAEIEAQKIKDDPDFAIVDRFLGMDQQWFPSARFRTKLELTDAHAKPGFSPFAIDPRLLSEEQKKKFASMPLLKKHKVFVKGGVSPNDAAGLLGVNGGDNLLNILSKTPTREDAVEVRVSQQSARLRKEAESSVDIDKTSMRFAYSRKLENNLKEMQILWDTSRGALKAGIKRISKAMPRKQDIITKAESVVANTAIGKLNANQFKINERKSRNKAVDSVMKNDLESAFTFKGAEMLNGELAIQTHTAIAKVNRALKFFARFETSQIQAELEFAGQDYIDAAREIIDTFRLTGSTRDVEETGSFAKFVEKMYQDGVTDLTIPDRLADPRSHVSELTVEQVFALQESLKGILHQARFKNELIKKHGRNITEEKTREMWAREIVEQGQQNPDYNEDKSVSTQDTSLKQAFINGADELLNYMFMNLEHLALKFDGKPNGALHTAVVVPLQDGLLGRAKDLVEFGDAYKKAVDRFGAEQFFMMGYKDIFVPEFENIPELNRGKMTEAKLVMMLLNMGNDGNKSVMAKNFGVSVETINTVLNRHLTEKHAVFAQSVMNMYKTLWPRVTELQRKMKGVEPEPVPATTFSIAGKTYDGGYFPRNYSMELDYKKLKKSTKNILDTIQGNGRIDMNQFNYADDMTRQGHTMERVGSDRPINLDMNMIGMGFESVIHDLNMRVPIANGIKIMTDSTVAKTLSSVVGKNGYSTMLNSVVRAATSTQMENNMLFSSTLFMDKMRASFRGGLSVAALAYRLPTVLIQPTSMIYSVERMGPTGVKHLGMVLDEVKTNPSRILPGGDIGLWAGEILTSLKLSGGDINENQRDPISKMTPKNYWRDPVSRRLSKYLKRDVKSVTHALDEIRTVGVDFAFNILGRVDDTQKVIVIAAAYSQFISGDAPGVDIDTVNAMAPEAREKAAKDYATSVARTTLTAGSILDRSEIQHNDPFMMAMFFNDVRNAVANHLRQGRGVRHAFEDGRYTDSATLGTVMILQMVAVQFMQDWARGNATPITSGRGEYQEDEEEMYADDPLGTTLKYLAGAPANILLGGTPYVRDVKFLVDKLRQGETSGRRQEATPVVTRMMTDVAYTAYAGMSLMDIVNGERDLTNNELKSIGYTASYLTGGLPINTMYDLYRNWEEGEYDTLTYLPESLAEQFKKKLGILKKTQAELDPEDRLPEAHVEALEQIAEQLEPEQDDDRIPNSVIETIGQIESGGKWWAKNPKSTAAGTYQFLEGTWEWIMDSAPELKLTMAGRTSADTSQQEAAMRWFTEHNAKRLKNAEIEVTAENLYAAHFLGASKAIGVLSAPVEMKLKTLVGESVMEANDFPSTMSVRSFNKWVADKVAGAKKQVEEKNAIVDNTERQQE